MTTTTTTNVTNFKLEALASDIKTGVRKIGRLVHKGLHEAKQIGANLIEAKSLCQTTGESFMDFVKKWCELSHRTATNYILIATHWDSIPEADLTNLSINKFVSLVSGGLKPKKAANPKQQYTGEYVQRMATECKIQGDVKEFLKRFGVRVAELAVAA